VNRLEPGGRREPLRRPAGGFHQRDELLRSRMSDDIPEHWRRRRRTRAIVSAGERRRQRRYGGGVAAPGRARDLGVSPRVLGDGEAATRSGRSGRMRRAAGGRCLGVGRARQPRREHRQCVARGTAAGGAARDVAGFRSTEPRSGCDVPGWLPPAWWCRGIPVSHLPSGAGGYGWTRS
jgi:hypothetical protein